MALLDGTGVRLLSMVLLGGTLFTSGTVVAVQNEHVQKLAAMLSREPAGFGRPISDREAWAGLAADSSYGNVLRDAEKLLKEPMPATTDELYLDFSRTGNRTRWQRVAGQRRDRIGKLTLAECTENEGRFLRALEETINGVYPAFADCSVGSRPSSDLMTYVNARCGLEIAEYESRNTVSPGELDSAMMYSFPDRWVTARVSPQRFDEDVLRSWFPDAGVLVCRQKEGTAGAFGVAMKGGHNNEHHNHNDVGSYLVVAGNRQVLTDPGAEVYTSRTFSSKRYDSKVLNSFGHPVPVVGGELQRTGTNARGKVLKSEFSKEQDTLKIDMRSAYKTPKLEKLERTFVYTRGKQPSFTVSDSIAGSEPLTYETALVTLGTWRREGDNTIIVEDHGACVTVNIDTGGDAFTLKADILDEDVRTKSKPTRIAITLDQPMKEGTVMLRITPE